MPSPSDCAPSSDLGDFRLILARMEPKDVSAEDFARRHAAMLAFGRRASAQPEIGVLMQDAMALLSEALDTDWGGAGEVLSDGRTLALKVAATDKHGKLVNPTTHSTPLAPDVSMAGYALNMACPVVSPNLNAEERFTDLLLRRLGVVSALCVPLNLGDEVFGALAVYAKEQRQFTNDDVHFAEMIGHLLTSAIARARAEEALARQQAFSAALVELADSLILALDLEGNLLDLNPACARVTGFSAKEIRGKPLWQVLIPPEEVELVRGILQTSLSGVRPCEFESSLLTKDGSRRRAVWAIKVIAGDGRRPSLVMVGTDRTDHLEMEAELEKAKQVAERATEAMNELRARVNAAAHLAGSGELPPSAPESAGRQTAPPPQPKGGFEQRASPRLAYHYRQLIAPMYGTRVPPRKDFFAVECNDISAGGISFLLDQRPDFENLVVALGRPPAETYFTAQVVRVAKTERGGRTRFIVGCRFTGRISL